MFEPEKLDDLLNNAPALRRVLEEVDRLRAEGKHLSQERELTWQMAMQYKEQIITLREQTQHLEQETRNLKRVREQELHAAKEAFDNERRALTQHLEDLQQRVTQQETDLQYYRRLPLEAPASKDYLAKLEHELAETKKQLAEGTARQEQALQQRFQEKRSTLEQEIRHQFVERLRALEEQRKWEQEERERQVHAASALQQELYSRLNHVEETLDQERLQRKDADRQRAALQRQAEQLLAERHNLSFRLEGLLREAEALRQENERLRSQRTEGTRGDGVDRRVFERQIKQLEDAVAKERAHREAAEATSAHAWEAAQELKMLRDTFAPLQQELAEAKGLAAQAAAERSQAQRELEEVRNTNEALQSRLTAALKAPPAPAGSPTDLPDAMKTLMANTERAMQEAIQRLQTQYDERERALRERLDAATSAAPPPDSETGESSRMQAEAERLRKEIERLTSLHGEERQRLERAHADALERAQQDRQTELALAKHARLEEAHARKKFEDERHALETDRVKLQGQLKEMQQVLAALRESSAAKIQELERALAERPTAAPAPTAEWETRLAEAEAAKIAAEEALERAHRTSARLREEIGALEEQLMNGGQERQQRQEGQEHEARHDELQKRLQDTEVKLAEAEEHLRLKEQESSEVKKQWEQTEGRVAELQKQLEVASQSAIRHPPSAIEESGPKVLWQDQAKVQAQGGLLVSELVFGIAHQLRNPLGIIKANVQYCLKTLKLKPREKDQLTMVVRNIEHIMKRIQEFVDFTRPMRFAMGSVSLVPLLQETLLLVKGRCEEQSIRVEVTFPPASQSPTVSGDQEKIKQVILNILVNAIEAMPEGGTLGMELVAHGSTVAVKIRDTGRGLKKEHLSQVMVPFFTTKEAGLGLGLAYSKQIIGAHHGTLELVSAGEQQGATVTVTFPALSPSPSA